MDRLAKVQLKRFLRFTHTQHLHIDSAYGAVL